MLLMCRSHDCTENPNASTERLLELTGKFSKIIRNQVGHAPFLGSGRNSVSHHECPSMCLATHSSIKRWNLISFSSNLGKQVPASTKRVEWK